MKAATPVDMTITESQAQSSATAPSANIGEPVSIDPQPPAHYQVKGSEVPSSISTQTMLCCPGTAYSYPAPYTRNALLTSLYNKYKALADATPVTSCSGPATRPQCGPRQVQRFVRQRALLLPRHSARRTQAAWNIPRAPSSRPGLCRSAMQLFDGA